MLRTPVVTPSQSHSCEIICGLGVAMRDIYVEYLNFCWYPDFNAQFKFEIQVDYTGTFLSRGQINVIVSFIVSLFMADNSSKWPWNHAPVTFKI